MSQSTTTVQATVPYVKIFGKSVLGFVVVALPSLVLMLFTLDAALIPGADAFVFGLVQVIFVAVYFTYRTIVYSILR